MTAWARGTPLQPASSSAQAIDLAILLAEALAEVEAADATIEALDLRAVRIAQHRGRVILAGARVSSRRDPERHVTYVTRFLALHAHMSEIADLLAAWAEAPPPSARAAATALRDRPRLSPRLALLRALPLRP